MSGSCSIIAPCNEEIVGFSALEQLRRLARDEQDRPPQPVSNGFLMEFIYLFRGLAGMSNIYDESEDLLGEIPEFLQLEGREMSISNGADLIIEMQRNDRPRGVFFQMAEEDVATLMRTPYNMIASDGKIEIPDVEVPHPRAYGTFPRVFARYVKQSGVLTLEDAVRKMTSLPAQAMDFADRGALRNGSKADVVVFDLETIEDTATYQEPHHYPKGIRYVIVNGKVAVREGSIVCKDAGVLIYGEGRKDR